MVAQHPTAVSPEPSFWRALMIIRSGITYVLPPEETEGLPDETLRLFRETLAEIDTWLDMSITNGWIKADLS
jgi:hypothetical protein